MLRIAAHCRALPRIAGRFRGDPCNHCVQPPIPKRLAPCHLRPALHGSGKRAQRAWGPLPTCNTTAPVPRDAQEHELCPAIGPHGGRETASPWTLSPAAPGGAAACLVTRSSRACAERMRHRGVGPRAFGSPLVALGGRDGVPSVAGDARLQAFGLLPTYGSGTTGMIWHDWYDWHNLARLA